MKRHHTILILLVLAWLIVAGWLEHQHYQAQVQSLIQTKTQEGRQEARSLSNHLQKSIDFIRSIPAMLAQETLLQDVLAQCQTNAPAVGVPVATGDSNRLNQVSAEALDKFLAGVKKTLGPDEAWVMNVTGDCIAASNSDETNSFVGVNYSDRDYFQQARLAQPAQQYAFGRRTRVPGLYFAARVMLHEQFAGVVAVKMNMDTLTNWLDLTNGFVVDGFEVIILANNPQLLMTALPRAPVEHLTVQRRQLRYHHDSFPTLAIEPWNDTNAAPLVFFNHEAPPQVLSSHKLTRESLRVYVPEPVPELLTLGRDYLWYYALLATAGGSLILFVGVSLQYSNSHRRANRILVSQQQELTEAQRIAQFGSWSCDLATGVLELSDQAAEIFQAKPTGLPVTYAIFTDLAGPADRVQVKNTIEQMLKQAEPCDLEYTLVLPSDAERMVHVQGRLVQDKHHRPVRLVGTVQDVTARKRVERESIQMVSLLKATLESTADGLLVVDRQGKITSYNEHFLQMWQLSDELAATRNDDLLLKNVLQQLKNPDAFMAKIHQLYGIPLAESFDLLEFKDGRIYERYSKPQLIEGEAVGRVWSFCDVTEQKRAEASVLETDRRLRILIEATMDVIFLKDGEGRWQVINQAARKAFALGNLDYQGKTDLELAGLMPRLKLELEYCAASDQQAWQYRQPFRSEEYLRQGDGQMHCYDVIKVPIFNDDGSRQGLVVVGRDITERKNTEAELFKSRETLQMVLNNIPQRVFWKNRELVFGGCNLPMARDSGFDDSAKLIGKNDFELVGREEAEKFQAMDREVMETDRPKLNYELTRVKPDGSPAHLLVNKLPLHDNEGRVIGVLCAYEDITERKLLEAQFRQSQKMEAIGRLAGGIAHDFNNLLTVICGYSELLLSETPMTNPARNALTEVKKAADRAVALTRQLLAFSRKQILEPDVLDLNAVLRDYENMFRRLVGEDITLALKLAPDLGKIKADASQVDQVLLNLVVNARDAMPRGGKLFIETANTVLDESHRRLPEVVVPGKYVSLTVRDTGCGMDAATLAHLFEPFFTTKDQGKGTGLGLAMIFGFIKQSGGHVSVASELGAGSIFTVYLPVIEETAAREPA